MTLRPWLIVVAVAVGVLLAYWLRTPSPTVKDQMRDNHEAIVSCRAAGGVPTLTSAGILTECVPR